MLSHDGSVIPNIFANYRSHDKNNSQYNFYALVSHTINLFSGNILQCHG